MVKERRSKNIGRKQRKKNNTHKRRVSKRNTLRRKSFRGGRPRSPGPPDFFKYVPIDVKQSEIGTIKVQEIITNAHKFAELKYEDLVTVKMVGTTMGGQISFPYTTKIKSFNVKGSGLGFRSYFGEGEPSSWGVKQHFNMIHSERASLRILRVKGLIGEEITDKEELQKVRTLFDALKGYAGLETSVQ